MVDEDEFRRWREEAGRALEGARAQAERRLYNWACFSCEQGAQLAVKALLHGLGRGPWGHDLDALIDSLRAAGVDVSEHVASAGHRLGRHYIPARYPDAHAAGHPGGHYGASDWQGAFEDAQTILTAVDTAWAGLR
jgi:HEPN domain-containing protein